jgi:hypothetical protein
MVARALRGLPEMPGPNLVKPRASLVELVIAAEDGGPADATKYRNTPIAEPAKAGPT